MSSKHPLFPIILVIVLLLSSLPSSVAMPPFLQSTQAFASTPEAQVNQKGPSTPAVINLSSEVITSNIEALGMNMAHLSSGTNMLTNNLIWGSGMEPGITRYLIRVERSGPGWIEWDNSGGVHMYDSYATGYGDGATIRFYRLADENGSPLSYGGGTALEDVTGADHVVFLGETTVPLGGWIAQGSAEGAQNRVYVANQQIQFAYGDYAMIFIKKNIHLREHANPRLYEWFNPNVSIMSAQDDGIRSILVSHPGTIPGDFVNRGETCLKLTFPADGGSAGQYLFHGYNQGEGQWYSQLIPGMQYRAEVWLRQEGLPGGSVRFVSNGMYQSISQTTPWNVTDQWQRFTYNFTAPAQYPSPELGHGTLGLHANGAGTLWVDNFLVYACADEQHCTPFTPNKLAFDEVMSVMPPSGPKPALRFYNTLYNGHSDMAHLLSNYANSNINYIYNVQGNAGQNTTVLQALNFALATGTNPQNRVVPYMTLSEEYTEVEWLQLMEYLGVPYDPATDTPQSKPWAFLRYQQRGIGTPWTDEFRQIMLEFGNESWHQGFYGWEGFGRPGWVHTGGKEYGLFARYYFAESIYTKAWWNENHLGDKIKIVLNANYEAAANSYGELAAQNAPSVASYLGHANYVGPKWETGETPFQSFDAHTMQETMVGAYLGMFPLMDQIASTRASLKQQGLADYRAVAYEGGPSGYYLNSQGATPEQEAISELNGKSLGMGVSALDAWLYATQTGYGHQEYFAMDSGGGWSSHTMPNAGGFRPHPGWLALKLRNSYAIGNEMTRVSFSSVPTYTREGEQVPLLSAYAIQGPETLSVFILSRKMAGQHDNTDFGDGTTPVTLNLPFTSCLGITRYALTHPDGSVANPMENNLQTTNIAITQRDLNASLCNGGRFIVNENSGGVVGGMPGGTVFLYVFRTREAPNLNNKLYLPVIQRPL